MLLFTVARTQMQAMQLSSLFLLPFVFLSGHVFPVDGMPKLFQLITLAIPAEASGLSLAALSRRTSSPSLPRDG